VKIPRIPHSWTVTPKEAVQIQRRLANRITLRGTVRRPSLVAGADLAFCPDRKQCVAGVVVWDVRKQEVTEQHVVHCKVRFPYVPGLLSFREAPAILTALRRLRCTPDVFMCDGQGYAHPRRFGLACHMGLLIDLPTVGCAKSILVGECDEPGFRRGSTARLLHHGETIGAAVRTRDHVKPVYVSVGHRLSLQAAIELTLLCGTRYRLPEPTRLADRLVARERF
jgi:deoxyribonuclease V